MVGIVENVVVCFAQVTFPILLHLETAFPKLEASERQLKTNIQRHDYRSWCKLVSSRRTVEGFPCRQLRQLS